MVLCAALFAAGNAWADGMMRDVPMASPPGRCFGGAFAGPYAGIQLGFGSTRSHQEVTQYADDGSPNGIAGLADNDRGFTIGGHGGYNVQCGGVVFGVETDFSYYGTDTESDVGVCGSAPCGGPVGSAAFQSSMDWFGTLRARLGIVGDDSYLIYATGGLAYANTDHRFITNVGPTGLISPPFSASSGGTQLGWTAGGGVEFMADENWSFRAEALYVDLGSDSADYTFTGACGATCTQHVGWDDDFWILRLGLTYHFHRPEPVADYTPLK
jgi:outer membrane immunogenic protein